MDRLVATPFVCAPTETTVGAVPVELFRMPAPHPATSRKTLTAVKVTILLFTVAPTVLEAAVTLRDVQIGGGLSTVEISRFGPTESRSMA